MKRAIVMVGLPRSGKSTRAKEIHKETGYPIVSGDCVRLALHGERFLEPAEVIIHPLVLLMARAILLNHDGVIIDECNVTQARRDRWIYGLHDCRIIFDVVNTSMEVCIQRASNEQDKQLVPVIKRMNSSYQPIKEE